MLKANPIPSITASLVMLVMLASTPTTQADSFVYAAGSDGNSNFKRFNVDTNTWQTLNSHRSNSQLATDQSGNLFTYNNNSKFIERYNPTADSWAPVVQVHSSYNSNIGNLQVTNDGRFILTSTYASVSNALHVYDSGSWSTKPLAFTPNAAGDYDPTTNQFVIGEWSSRNIHMIDLTTPTYAVTDFIQAGGASEHRRAGSILNGKYYTQAGNNTPFDVWNLSNSLTPPTQINQPASGIWPSTTADRFNNSIYAINYSNGLFYKVNESGVTTLLPNANTSFGHSTLAFVPDPSLINAIPLPTASLAGALGFGIIAITRRKRPS